MRAVRRSGTAPELAVRKALRRLGIRYRSRTAGLPGTPDLILVDRRVALFVHGCFWHGHSCKRGSVAPRTRSAFWKRKRDINRERDRRAARALRARGWRVAVIWECQIRSGKRLAALIEQLHRSG
jgi:DNA mismatch endonuclease (patch repair protein)